MITFLRIFRSILLVGVLTIGASISIAQDETRSTNVDPDGVHMHSIRNPGQTAPSFTLAISTKTTEFRVGSSVRINVAINNITKHTIDYSDWYSDAGEMSYSYDVRDEDGNSPQKIVHQHPELDTPSYYWGAISPGESRTTQLRISQIYKFDRPGKYTIQLLRADQDCLDENGKPVVVKSNTITILITG